jgi:hypothetical protein
MIFNLFGTIVAAIIIILHKALSKNRHSR